MSYLYNNLGAPLSISRRFYFLDSLGDLLSCAFADNGRLKVSKRRVAWEKGWGLQIR